MYVDSPYQNGMAGGVLGLVVFFARTMFIEE